MTPSSRLGSLFQRRTVTGQYDWTLLSIVIAISLCGVAFVGSAIVTRLQTNPTPATFLGEFFQQILLGFWFGGVLTFIFTRLDYHILFRWKRIILLGTLFLLASLAVPIAIARIAGIPVAEMFNFFEGIPIRPRFIENAGRWIAIGNVGGFTFQPAEIAKLTLLIYFAGSINQIEGTEINWDSFKRPLYVFVAASAMIVIQPDLGSVVMLMVILGMVLWISHLNPRLVAIGVLVSSVFVAIFIFSVGYRRERFFAWFNSTVAAQQQDTSNLSQQDIERFRQVSNVQAAIQNGGLFGQGYGQGELKKFVPEVSSDAIIAVIAEEAGFIFTIGFLSLYLWLFFRALSIAQRAPDAGGKALAAGVGAWILFQAFWNVAGITGLIPLKGLPLPFISEGGTSVAVNLAAIGVLMNVSSQATPVEKNIHKKT